MDHIYKLDDSASSWCLNYIATVYSICLNASLDTLVSVNCITSYVHTVTGSCLSCDSSHNTTLLLLDRMTSHLLLIKRLSCSLHHLGWDALHCKREVGNVPMIHLPWSNCRPLPMHSFFRIPFLIWHSESITCQLNGSQYYSHDLQQIPSYWLSDKAKTERVIKRVFASIATKFRQSTNKTRSSEGETDESPNIVVDM